MTRLWVGLAVSICLSASCTSDTAAGSESPTTAGGVDTIAGQLSVEEFGLPGADAPLKSDATAIDRSPIELALGYETDPAKAAAEYNADQVRYFETYDSCMGEEGFGDRYETPTPLTLEPEDMFPPDTPGRLRVTGYGTTARLRGLLEGLKRQHDADSATGQQLSPDGPVLTETEAATIGPAIARCDRLATDSSPSSSVFTLPTLLANEVNEVRATASDSEQAGRAWADWSRCMEEEGYDMSDRGDAGLLVDRLAAPTDEALAQAEQVLMEGGDVTADTENELTDMLNSVARQEREIANADAMCTERTSVDDKVQEVVYQAEANWLADNGDRISLLVTEGQ